MTMFMCRKVNMLFAIGAIEKVSELERFEGRVDRLHE